MRRTPTRKLSDPQLIQAFVDAGKSEDLLRFNVLYATWRERGGSREQACDAWRYGARQAVAS
jgi:hypothetical protein